jgi:hypothetical protein
MVGGVGPVSNWLRALTNVWLSSILSNISWLKVPIKASLASFSNFIFHLNNKFIPLPSIKEKVHLFMIMIMLGNT